MRTILATVLLAVSIHPAAAVDFRWGASFSMGTLEIIVDNRHDSRIIITCPYGRTDTTPGIDVKITGLRKDATRVHFVVDGKTHDFEGDDFDPHTKPAWKHFRELIAALASSKRPSFQVIIPESDRIETFSLLEASRWLGHGKDTAIEGCDEKSQRKQTVSDPRGSAGPAVPDDIWHQKP